MVHAYNLDFSESGIELRSAAYEVELVSSNSQEFYYKVLIPSNRTTTKRGFVNAFEFNSLGKSDIVSVYNLHSADKGLIFEGAKQSITVVRKDQYDPTLPFNEFYLVSFEQPEQSSYLVKSEDAQFYPKISAARLNSAIAIAEGQQIDLFKIAELLESNAANSLPSSIILALYGPALSKKTINRRVFNLEYLGRSYQFRDDKLVKIE